MGYLECQTKALYQQGELFPALQQIYTRRTLEGWDYFWFLHHKCHRKYTMKDPVIPWRVHCSSPLSLIPLPPLHILWTSKKILWRHVIKQFFIQAPLFDDPAVRLNCSVHRMWGRASWRPILVRKGRSEFVNEEGKGRKERDQKAREEFLVSLACLNLQSSHLPEGSGVQEPSDRLQPAKCFVHTLPSCAGFKHESPSGRPQNAITQLPFDEENYWFWFFPTSPPVFPSERFIHFYANKTPWGRERNDRKWPGRSADTHLFSPCPLNKWLRTKTIQFSKILKHSGNSQWPSQQQSWLPRPGDG